jgi:excinuclease UvrABC helicase subunit UvrB
MKQKLIARRGNLESGGALGISLAPPIVDAYSIAMAERRSQLEAMRDETDEPKNLDETDSRLEDGDPRTGLSTILEHPFTATVVELRRRMESAIMAEDYEAAAQLRDAIKCLEGLDASRSRGGLS